MPKEEPHVHKYMRVKLGDGKFQVFRCMLPDCPHYIRRELVPGRKSICWRCGTEFIMTMRSATLMKPHCFSCKKSPSGAGGEKAA